MPAVEPYTIPLLRVVPRRHDYADKVAFADFQGKSRMVGTVVVLSGDLEDLGAFFR